MLHIKVLFANNEKNVILQVYSKNKLHAKNGIIHSDTSTDIHIIEVNNSSNHNEVVVDLVTD